MVQRTILYTLRHSLLIVLILGFLPMGMPGVLPAQAAVEIIDTENQNISITINGDRLHVVGASGAQLYTYNVAGVRISTIRIDGNDKYIDLGLPKGCYIVKVGKVVRKISVS